MYSIFLNTLGVIADAHAAIHQRRALAPHPKTAKTYPEVFLIRKFEDFIRNIRIVNPPVDDKFTKELLFALG